MLCALSVSAQNKIAVEPADTPVSNDNKLNLGTADTTFTIPTPDTPTIVEQPKLPPIAKQDSNTQAVESVVVKKRHSPKKAVIYSAVLPGLGQIYNKKYWKAPIVWAGIGGFTYLIISQNRKHKCYQTAYRLQVDDDPTTMGICDGFESSGQLRTLRDTHKRNLDLSILGLVLWYGLNLVDATVDAHLFEYDIGDDLSLGVQPNFQIGNTVQQPNSLGITLTLRP